ncbi:MAG: hypothetical protein SO232_01515 [Candidatus Onthovivens sp.]|nr:hypothetical protein [Candidatus Onthovivens sp.]
MKKISKYREGVLRANKDINCLNNSSFFKRLSSEKKKKYIHDKHEFFDKMQYEVRANRGAKASDFYRGLAMGYGYFYHTGKLL